MSDIPLTYFNISDLGCKTVVNMIKGKDPEEIRNIFNISNDFTPEEEVYNFLFTKLCNMLITSQAQIQKENVSSMLNA